ncbi:MAG: hypothetical protein Dasosvirus1_33 [Dasosvirus sp.]|uniref:Uncharacterized protein n=1 Tax=Dasosvirus sp. TaxID=2487764 RepID=A0A3G4ZR72_9VIRU|nr:MAG: hypothetical protein Dasosvirus1_33 [Dasosvirus sp.]
MDDFEKYYTLHIDELKKISDSVSFDRFVGFEIDIKYKAFWLACTLDNLDTVQSILVSGQIDVNKMGHDRSNSFNTACFGNTNLQVIKFLETHTNDIKLKDRDDNNALHNASAQNNVSVIKYLIKELKFNPRERKESDGDDCFLLACTYNKNIEVIKYFVEEHKNVDSINYLGQNAVYSACAYNKNPEIAKYLIKNCKIQLNKKCNHGNNGFIGAIYAMNQPIIDYLLQSNYCVLFGKISNNIDIKISEEQKFIMDLMYGEKDLNTDQKDKIVKFIIDNQLTGYLCDSQIINKLGYNRILKLAINGLIISHDQELEKPQNYSLYFEECEINLTKQTECAVPVLTIDSTIYYAHKDLLLLGSHAYRNIYTMITDKENISFDLKISSEIVKIYLRTFYTGSYHEISELGAENLLELCQLVIRIPTKILSVKSLEYFLVKTFDPKFIGQYEHLVRNNELCHLMILVFR